MRRRLYEPAAFLFLPFVLSLHAAGLERLIELHELCEPKQQLVVLARAANRGRHSRTGIRVPSGGSAVQRMSSSSSPAPGRLPGR